MFGSPLGLQRPGAKPARMAPRTHSGVHPSSGAIGMRRLGLGRVGAGSTHHQHYTYSEVLPSTGALGCSRVGLQLLGGLGRRVGKARPKKQTGVPLRALWSSASPPKQVPTRGVWGQSTPLPLPCRGAWQTGAPMVIPRRARWAAAQPDDAARRLPWAGERMAQFVQIPARRGQPIGRALLGTEPVIGIAPRVVMVQRGTRLEASTQLDWGIATARDAAERLPWGVFARSVQRSTRLDWGIATARDAARRLPWALYAATADAAQPADWLAARRADTPERFPFGARRPLQAGWGVVVETGEPPTDANGTILIPVRRVYLVTNQADLVLTPSGTPLNCTQMQVSIDADSWGWSFSATLAGRDWATVQPNSNGDPVTAQASINGYAFAVLIESRQRSRQFGQTSVQITGRGIAAVLASPIAPVQTFTNSADRTAQQLMTDALTNTGWTVDWGITDWLVPAGAFSQRGAPMDAITAIAGAVSAVVQADPLTQTLHILPRYKAAPWQWATTTPDINLPLDPVLTDSLDESTRPAYNRIYVAGNNGSGRIGQITRDGTAGDVLAPMVTDALLTATEALQQRGIAELSNTGRAYKIGLTLPISADVPLLGVGQLVQYDQAGENRRGLVRGLSVSAQWQSGLVVRQNPSLEVRP